MKLEFTPAQEKMRLELREYFKEFMTPALKNELFGPESGEGGGPEWRKGLKKLGTDGWIGVGWPKEFGGQEIGAIEQYIFTEELAQTGFPFPFLTVESVGPTVARFGSDEMKKEIIPRILQGELNICIGYSEPGSGTDLASLKTKAVRDCDDYIINGQKIFTSLAHFADYVWLACRTDHDPATKKHKGISMFLIPFDTPGISLTPIHTLGGVRTNTTYYEDVRVPARYMVGEENQGWKLITGQLNRERLALATHGPVSRMFRRVCEWATETKQPNGERVIDQPWVQTNLAKVQTGAEALKLICYKQAWAIDRGEVDKADASSAKVFSSEYFIEAYRLMTEVLGQGGIIARGSKAAILEGSLERSYRSASILTFGGGCNEVQRDIISAAGLYIPRAGR
jgi:alkylation response protein AidB-like acyl-CoA dehydrogenase